jgi:hypothetical protein
MKVSEVVVACGHELCNEEPWCVHLLVLSSRLRGGLGARERSLSQDSRILSGRDRRTSIVSYVRGYFMIVGNRMMDFFRGLGRLMRMFGRVTAV